MKSHTRMNKIETILANASDTKKLLIGRGVIDRTPEMFAILFPGKRPIIVADPTTWRVAGEKLQALFMQARLTPDRPYMLDDPHLHAEWCFIEELEEHLKNTDAIAVAVGSGTINDLTKLVSDHLGRRYMTVGTAASMDGYTAYGASITRNGAKQTFSCRAPLGFVADINVIATAPKEMTASGYADLFAKIPAGADWILSEEVGVEPVDPESFGVVQGELKSALGSPEALAEGNLGALHSLIEGLLMSGFAMQIHKSSRPASGADHQFSHLWNMEHHRMADATVPSHGFQVSIGTIMSTALYEQFLAEDFSNLDVESCVAAWPTLEEQIEVSREMFRNTDFPTIGVTELTAKYATPDELRRQLTALRDNWSRIQARIYEQIVPLAEVRRRLALVGAPVRPEQIGISRERLRRSAIRAQQIRRRFTILDIAVRTGKLEKWLDSIFS